MSCLVSWDSYVKNYETVDMIETMKVDITSQLNWMDELVSLTDHLVPCFPRYLVWAGVDHYPFFRLIRGRKLITAVEKKMHKQEINQTEMIYVAGWARACIQLFSPVCWSNVIFQQKKTKTHCLLSASRNIKSFPLGIPATFLELNSAYQPQAKSNFAVFSEALLTEQVSSREGGWMVVSQRKGCHFCGLFRLWFSGVLSQEQSSILFLWNLSSVINLSSAGHATKCVGLNECTKPRTLSNLRAGRHNRSLAKSAICLQCCCWPLSKPWSLFHARWCHIFNPAQSPAVAALPRVSASTSR